MRETDRPTLLIVDDEPMALDALQQALQSKFDVLPAHSGPEALELLRSRPVQVLVTDQRMPGMSGVEVLAAARAERPEAARVMLTGDPDLQDFADAVNLGGVEYCVTKPWDADELVEVLQRAAAMARRAEKEIADRRQAQAAAHRAEADLSALIENSDTSLWSLDRDYRLLAFNTRFREAAHQGLGREISIGENILPEVPEAIREEWTSHYDRCLRGESFRIVTPTVPPLPLRINEYRFNPIRLADGQVAGLTVFANDVTERWQAEANLVASEKRYRALYQSLMDAYVQVDMSGRIVQYNETFRAMLGYSDDELRQLTYVDLTPEKWHAYEQKIVSEQVLPLGYSQVYEKEYRRKDGTVFPIELRTSLIRDEAGRPESMWAIIRDITERKRAEERVAWLASFPEQNPNPVIEVDDSGTVDYMNPAAQQLFPDLSAKGFEHPWLSGLKSSAAAFKSERAGALQREVRVGALWFAQSVHCVLEVERMRIYGNDITERKQAEESLRESEKWLRAIYDQAGVGVAQVEIPSGRFVRVNQRYCELLGYTEAEMQRLTFQDITPPEDLEADLRQTARLQAGEIGQFSLEKRLRRRDGSLVWVNLTVSPLSARGEQLRYHVSLVEDITRRRQAEAALRQERDQAQLYLDVVEVLILALDTQGHIQLINKKGCEILGYSAPEMLGRNWFDLCMPPDKQTEIKAVFDQLMSGKSPGFEHYENEVVARSGAVRTVTFHNALLRDASGQITGILSSGEDITERKHAEEEVHRQAARAEALVQTAARLNGQLDLNKTLQAVCEETTRALNVPVAVVDLYDQRRRALCYVADVGLPAELRGYALPLRREALASSLAAAPANAGLLAALNSPATATMALRRDDAPIGAVHVFAADGARQFTVDELALLRGLADHASQAITNARLYEQVRSGHEQLQMLSRQLVQAQETERQALAHELHDQIGQNLTGLSLNLNILRSLLSAEAAAPLRRRLDDSLALVSETMRRVRNVMAELRPPALDDYGLLAALRWHGEQLTARTGLRVRVEGVEVTPRLSPAEENALFRIAQEALANAVKHAAATQAAITLEAEPGLIRLTVEDNGGGFNPAGRRQPGSQGGWGLTFMRERAIAIGGQLHVESASGQGTRIVAEVRR